MNNNFSTKNSYLYKMKFINCRNVEYEIINNFEFGKIEKFNDKKPVLK